MGSWKFLSGVINVAAFPVLCIEYLVKLFPVLESGWQRTVAIIVAIIVLSFINYLGLNIVGYAAVGLGIISLSPFVLMTLIAIPKIRPKRWLSMGEPTVKKDWNLFLNTLFWNLNFWDNISTLAGEVDKPGKTFPIALPVAVIMTCLSYLIPLFAVIGALDVKQTQWGPGFHATAAEMIAGNWLKIWLEICAALSTMGLFEAQLSSCSFQILGMAELGILPKFFAIRSKWFHTPWVGILVPALMTLGVSFLQFTDIISSANFIYSLSMLLEIASFLWLRWKMPQLERPYRIPMRLPLLCAFSLIPIAFLVLLLVIATKIVYLISGAMTAGAILWYLLMNFCRKKNCCTFSIDHGHQPNSSE
ncbi:Probable polyamine transporter At3g13620 [Linum perenne]